MNVLKKILIKIILLAVLVVGINGRSPQAEEVHIHAGFKVYKDNELQDFSGFEHMKIQPCYGDGEHPELTPEEEQLELAHLHDGVGDVVHVHRSGAVWRDLFANANIHIEVNPQAYVNGEKVENILSIEIKPYDSVVIFEGENTNIEDKLSTAVSREHIVEIEGMSENCSS